MLERLKELLGEPDRVFAAGGTWWGDVTPSLADEVCKLGDSRIAVRAVYAYKSGDEQRYNIGWAEDWTGGYPDCLDGVGSHDLARQLLAGPDLPIVNADGYGIIGISQATMLTARQKERAERIARNEDEGSYLKRIELEKRRMAPQQVVVVVNAAPPSRS